MLTQPLILVGCGQMGSAIVRGLAAKEPLVATKIWLVDQDRSKAQALARDLGAKVGWPEEPGACTVLLAVKPKDVPNVLVKAPLGPLDTLVSVAAGLTLKQLRSWAPEVRGVVRTMPNTPCLVQRGVTGVYASQSVDVDEVVRLFESVGEVVVLQSERDFDGLTALSGSGPAYVFVALEAMADAGVMAGLDRQTARTLAIGAFEGAAALAKASEEHTAELKDRVASPAGTTIAALRELERHNFRSAWMAAVEAAVERSREMGQGAQTSSESD